MRRTSQQASLDKARSLGNLESLLGPTEAKHFLGLTFDKKPLIVSGSPDRFLALLDFDAVSEILNLSPFPHPRLLLIRQGRVITPNQPEDVVRSCREGATLILNEIDRAEPRVGEFASALALELRVPVKINMYLSQADQQGFSTHYDTHDAFILQVAGRKHWRIYTNRVEAPLFDQKSHPTTPPSEILIERTLTAGDVLYLPRGFWHDATATETHSLHLTTGLYAKTGVDFLTWFAQELTEDALFRRVLPIGGSGLGNERANESWCSHISLLRDHALKRLADSEALASAYHEFLIAEQRPRRPFVFPDAYAPTLPLSLDTRVTRSATQQALIKHDDGVIRVIVWGKVFTFAIAAVDAIRFIFDNTDFRVRDVSVRLQSPSAAQAILETLIREGVLLRHPTEEDGKEPTLDGC